MVTEANWQNWRPEHFRRYCDIVFEAFGARRIMYGSDWPVCLLAGSYQRVYDLAAGHCSRLSAFEQEMVFGGTAQRFYRLN